MQAKIHQDLPRLLHVATIIKVQNQFLTQFGESKKEKQQVYPPLDVNNDKLCTRLQERLLRKLGQNAYPFFFKLPNNSPCSVTLQVNNGFLAGKGRKSVRTLLLHSFRTNDGFSTNDIEIRISYSHNVGSKIRHQCEVTVFFLMVQVRFVEGRRSWQNVLREALYHARPPYQNV